MALIDLVQMVMGLISLFIFTYVAASKRTRGLVYRPFIIIFSTGLILFSLTEPLAFVGLQALQESWSALYTLILFYAVVRHVKLVYGTEAPLAAKTAPPKSKEMKKRSTGR